MGIFEDLFEGGHHRRQHDRDGHHDPDSRRHRDDDHHHYGTERVDPAYPPPGHGSGPALARCRSCNAGFAQVPGLRFCPFCGTPVAPTACGSCGAAAAPGASFCHGCGQKL
jgi:hypothetical protein